MAPYILKFKNEEFLEAKKDDFPLLEMKDLKVEWITFLCHEEMASQGDIDEHILFSHGFNMNELPDEKRIKKNKKSNLVLQEATDLKTLSENSLDTLMESWYESAVANNILYDDKRRTRDKIRPEKSIILVATISKAIGPAIEETFKIKLMNKLEGNQNVETGFSCKWTKIEEAIKDTLGQSPNVERLSKYMNTGDRREGNSKWCTINSH